MSYNDEIKTLLSKLENEEPQENESQLYGMIQAGSSVFLKGRGSIALCLHADSAPIAKCMYALFKRVFRISCEINKKETNAFGGRLSYEVFAPSSSLSKEILHFYGMLDQQANFTVAREIDLNYLQTPEQRRSYLRGVYLVSGYTGDAKSGAQLEFTFQSEAYADAFINFNEEFEMKLQKRQKKNAIIVYSKKSETISRILALTGAYRYALDFEDKLAMREMKNVMQRKVNCETANLNKTLDAALIQTQAAEKIIKTVGLNSLPEPLIEAAHLRLDNPYSSLSEMAALAKPPVSRSTLDKRLRRLIRIAQES